MFGGFFAYIKTIAAFFLFSVFAEMAAPENGYKKYLHVVLGFIMLLTILEPIQQIFSIGSYRILELFEEEGQEAAAAFSAVNAKADGSTQMVTEIYRNNLKEKIIESLSAEGIEVLELQVFTEEDVKKENYGEILQVQVTLDSEEPKKDIGIKKIEPVQWEREKPEKAAEEPDAREEQIKDIVHKVYGVAENRVTVVSS